MYFEYVEHNYVVESHSDDERIRQDAAWIHGAVTSAFITDFTRLIDRAGNDEEIIPAEGRRAVATPVATAVSAFPRFN
jgi:hypothetical protein